MFNFDSLKVAAAWFNEKVDGVLLFPPLLTLAVNINLENNVFTPTTTQTQQSMKGWLVYITYIDNRQ